jgi:hypothetical protein
VREAPFDTGRGGSGSIRSYSRPRPGADASSSARPGTIVDQHQGITSPHPFDSHLSLAAGSLSTSGRLDLGVLYGV